MNLTPNQARDGLLAGAAHQGGAGKVDNQRNKQMNAEQLRSKAQNWRKEAEMKIREAEQLKVQAAEILNRAEWLEVWAEQEPAPKKEAA